jgi:hypothetical protein
LSSPGRAFASATNSWTDFTGNEEGATRRLGVFVAEVMGAKSCSGSQVTLSCVSGASQSGLP